MVRNIGESVFIVKIVKIQRDYLYMVIFSFISLKKMLSFENFIILPSVQ